jgi:hypothetical protein
MHNAGGGGSRASALTSSGGRGQALFIASRPLVPISWIDEHNKSGSDDDGGRQCED